MSRLSCGLVECLEHEAADQVIGLELRRRHGQPSQGGRQRLPVCSHKDSRDARYPSSCKVHCHIFCAAAHLSPLTLSRQTHGADPLTFLALEYPCLDGRPLVRVAVHSHHGVRHVVLRDRAYQVVAVHHKHRMLQCVGCRQDRVIHHLPGNITRPPIPIKTSSYSSCWT